MSEVMTRNLWTNALSEEAHADSDKVGCFPSFQKPVVLRIVWNASLSHARLLWA